MKKNQTGFSILEVFVALAIGAFLIAGVLSVFVGVRTTTEETSSIGELQENARFALNILTNDLLHQGFAGDLQNFSLIQNAPNNPAGLECQGAGTNNGTFPRAVSGHFRSLWGTTVTGANTMSCARVNEAVVNSDLVQIKRVLTFPEPQNDDGSLSGALNNQRYYLLSNINTGTVFSGADTPPVSDNGRYWQYQHHVYYVRNETVGGTRVPVLMQGRLTTGMVFEPLIEGIEMIRFMYGVDTDGDGVVNAFISANNMQAQFWDNEAVISPTGEDSNMSILAIKVFVLARSLVPDADYENRNTYQLGDLSVNFINNGRGDNFRRLLMSSTVSLFNARNDVW